jgi:hypothetical protein
MYLKPNGIDVFYVDESVDSQLFIVSAVTISLLRPEELGPYRFVWEDYFDLYTGFRSDLRKTHGIPVRKELHASKLASGRGAHGKNGHQLGSNAGAALFRWILQRLDRFLPPFSVITVTANGERQSGE